jgi:hypothetical protein
MIRYVLRLSTQSFHYRTVRYVMGENYFLYRLNLCKYFWTFVLSTFLIPFVLFKNFLEAAAYNINWPKVRLDWPKIKRGDLIQKLALTGVNLTLIALEIYLHAWYWAVFLIAITVFIWFSRSFFRWSSNWELKWQREHPPKVKKPREPNLTLEYLKAKKGRFCPYIVWVE